MFQVCVCGSVGLLLVMAGERDRQRASVEHARALEDDGAGARADLCPRAREMPRLSAHARATAWLGPAEVTQGGVRRARDVRCAGCDAAGEEGCAVEFGQG